MKEVFCINFDNKQEAHWHILAQRNLRVVRALKDSNLCNIYVTNDNSLIIEVPAIMATMQQVQEIYRSVMNQPDYKILFADQYNYFHNFTIA